MAHLLDCLLMRPYVKDEGLARYIDDVMAKPQLVFRVELYSCHRMYYLTKNKRAKMPCCQGDGDVPLYSQKDRSFENTFLR